METAEEAITEGLNYCETANKSNKVFFLATFEKFMKEWTGGYRIVIKSTPIITGYIPLMSIGYKYNYRKVLGIITTEGYGSTETGDPYLYHFSESYSNVSILPVFKPLVIGRGLNSCNEIFHHNSMQHSDTALDKYCLTQSGHFTLETTLVLGMGITDAKLLSCYGVSDQSREK